MKDLHLWVFRIGRSSFTAEELTQNTMTVLESLKDRIEDENLQSIQQLFVCTGDSVRLPIYQTFPDPSQFPFDIENTSKPSKKKRRNSTVVEDPLDALIEEQK